MKFIKITIAAFPLVSYASRIISHRESTASEDCARCILSFNTNYCQDPLQQYAPIENHCCDLKNATDVGEPYCQSNQLWYYYGDRENIYKRLRL